MISNMMDRIHPIQKSRNMSAFTIQPKVCASTNSSIWLCFGDGSSRWLYFGDRSSQSVVVVKVSGGDGGIWRHERTMSNGDESERTV